MSIIFRPTESVINICDLSDLGLEIFLKAISREIPGQYDVCSESFVIMLQCVRIFESIIELARKDLVCIQSALILSRSLFEGCVKISWILYPPDMFECESRYLSYLETEIDFLKKLKNVYVNTSEEASKIESRHTKYMEFRDGVAALLKKKGHKIPKIPNTREMLKSLGEERKYLNYMLLCQFTHLSHYAGNTYRQNLGSEKVFTETAQMDNWNLVFNICWPVFELAAEFYLFRVEQKDTPYNDSFKNIVRTALLNINPIS